MIQSELFRALHPEWTATSTWRDHWEILYTSEKNDYVVYFKMTIIDVALDMRAIGMTEHSHYSMKGMLRMGEGAPT